MYLEIDCRALADVFETYREQSMEDCGLDPSHFITLPSFGWEAMLRKTGMRLELLHTKELFDWFRKRIRGGTSHIGKRIATADKISKIRRTITYLDANILYGYAMMDLLPKGGFQWA